MLGKIAADAIVLSCKIQTPKFSLTQKQQDKARIAAERFCDSIKSGKLSAPSFTSVIVHNAFRAQGKLEPPLSECDAEYWKQSGFVDKVYPIRIGVLKRLLGMTVFALMKRMLSKVSKGGNSLR